MRRSQPTRGGCTDLSLCPSEWLLTWRSFMHRHSIPASHPLGHAPGWWPARRAALGAAPRLRAGPVEERVVPGVVSSCRAHRSPLSTAAATYARLCLIGTVSSYAPWMLAVPGGVWPELAAWGQGPPTPACCSSPATLLAVDETWVRRMPTLTGLVSMRVPVPVPSCPFWSPPQAHSVPELSMA